MVFSSIPVYLDSANWQQQQNHHQSGSSSGADGVNPQFLPPPPPLPPQHPHGGHSGSIRPGSMADRARMANISLPEAALKCPRCESTNTKFCYFNNYSLTQPRHFCKTCRRYWTRGGALRNVPVGGGCRRNKRSKGSSAGSSKSPVSGDRQAAATAASSAPTTSSILGLSSQIPPLRFMSPLHQLTDYGEAGLNYGGISAPVGAAGDMSFQIGGGGGYLSGGGMEQWRLQQTQILLGGLEGQSGLYPFQGGAETSGYAGEASQQVRPGTSASGLIQMAPVKMEENQELSLSRQFMGIQGNDQYWSGTATAAWTDLSGFSSSSTSNPL